MSSSAPLSLFKQIKLNPKKKVTPKDFHVQFSFEGITYICNTLMKNNKHYYFRNSNSEKKSEMGV